MKGQPTCSYKKSVALFTGLVGLACLVALAACGGDGAATTPDTKTAENAAVGKSVASNLWEITLVDQPYLVKQCGAGTSSTYGSSSTEQDWDTDVQIAEGIFLIAPVQLTNGADEMRMFTKSTGLVVTDGQDQEISLSRFTVHKTCVYFYERWGANENYLVDNPIDAGVTWEGPVIFDVPEGASGFVMSFGESDGSVDLGL